MNVPSGYTALGLIGFTDQGVYNSATAYVRNDIVHYNGNLWRCLVDDTTAVTPAEGANWTVYLAEPTSAAEDIIAPVEATATSTRIYAIGDQLILADVLYDVTQAINIGDTLTVGTNIAAADTIVEQIAEKANSADLATVATSGAYSDLSGKPTLGTAAAKNVPASGDASTTEVVMGDDTRLINARNAADVSAWAKAANKPIYNGSEIKTSTAKTGTAQQSISDTVTSGTSMDNVVGTMLDNDKTLDTNVTSLKETLTNEVEARATLGAHNLFEPTFSKIESLNTSGTWAQINSKIWKRYTIGNLTITVNNDFTFKINGSHTERVIFVLDSLSGSDFKSKYVGLKMRANGLTSSIQFRAEQTVSPYSQIYVDQSNPEKVITDLTVSGTKGAQLYINIPANTSVSNITVEPMMLVETDNNTAFSDYVPTNKRLLSYKDNAILGAKNLINTAVLRNASPVAGIQFKLNDDNSITITGGTTNSNEFQLFHGFISGGTLTHPLLLRNTTYIFSIGEGKAQANISVNVYIKETSSSSWKLLKSDMNVDSIMFTTPSTIYDVWLRVQVAANTSISTTTLYPMLRLATDIDPTYQPYAMTNKELTNQLKYKYILTGISSVGVTADGTKTYQTLLSEAFQALKDYAGNHTDEYIKVIYFALNGSVKLVPSGYGASKLMNGSNGIYSMAFYRMSLSSGHVYGTYIEINSSSTPSSNYYFTSDNNTATSLGTSVPESGKTLQYDFEVYKKIS